MKILHVITSLQTGGAEKLMVDLLPRLRDAGHEVELAIFDGRITPFYEQLQQKGITIHRFMPNGGNVYNPINFWKLYRLMRKGRYDIVHTHNTAPQLFAAIGSVLCSVVTSTTEHNTANRRRAWRWYAAIDRCMYNRYRKVICISQKAEENLRQYIGHCKADICTINNGVEIAKYANATASPDLDAIALGSRKIIMVAGFREQKDQDTLIKSLRYLPEKFYLFLVGDGVRRGELEALIASENLSPRVHLLGLRTDVPNLLHAADYIVMSSHFEGLSLSSVEGMSVGKPFLASDVDGLREVVKGAGILFLHQDAEALAKEILALEASPEYYRAVAAACRRRADNFDISSMAASYSNLYKSL